MIPIQQGSSNQDIAAAYERHFNALAEIAAGLEIPPDAAGALIDDILLTSLVSRPIADIDSWLAGALIDAATRRKEHEP